MTTRPPGLLITGVGHSGTRLATRMFGRHPSVEIPEDRLNKVAEFPALHRYFIEAIDRTPIASDDYAVEASDVRLLMDAYADGLDPSGRVVVKMPFYPLTCLDAFASCFDPFGVLYVTRPVEKVHASYARREEDARYFEDPKELLRQVKKLPADQRARHLADRDPAAWVQALIETSASRMAAWRDDRPDVPVRRVGIETLATDRGTLGEVLTAFDLDAEPADAMLEVVDPERLLEGRQDAVTALKRWLG